MEHGETVPASEVAEHLMQEVDEVGELVPTPYCEVADQPYAIGETVLFRIPARRDAIMSGTIIQIVPGHLPGYVCRSFVPSWTELVYCGDGDLVWVGLYH